MENINRRSFLKNTGSATAVSLLGMSSTARVLGANDRVRVAVVGVRGRGFNHVEGFGKLANAEVAALCEVDDSVTAKRVADMEKLGLKRPKTYVDIRKLLEDSSIDAVSIATPNHWHSLMGIWAAQAGKDIYIEKPCSHNWWEGRQLVRAVKKYNRICQHGSQSRSNPGMIEGIRQVQSGLIGDVYLARALCFKWRDTIGMAGVAPVPPGVDYDLWTGPAPKKPFTKNRFHYNWHWIWDTGNGDLGNQGIHEVDIARWGLGVKFPVKVSAIGGHFVFKDDQETPNTLNSAFEFVMPDGTRRMMEVEVRHWISNHEAEIGTGAFQAEAPPAAGLSAPAAAKPAPSGRRSGWDKNTIGNIFYGSKGYVSMEGYTSYKSWLGENQEPGPSGKGGGNHFANFIECVRSRRAEEINAPIEEGHISATLVHLANVSYRLGRTINFDPQNECVIGDDEATQMLRGTYRAPFVVLENV